MTVHTLDLGALFGLDEDAMASRGPPHGLALDATGRRLVVNVGGALHEFDLRDSTRTQQYSLDDAPFEPCESWCVTLRYTLDARVLGAIYVEQNGGNTWSFARLFDCATGRCIAKPDVSDGAVLMAFDADGERLLSADDCSVRVHRVRDGAELGRLEVAQQDGAAWDPISGAVTVLDRGVVRAHDPRSLKELRRYEIPADLASLFDCGAIQLRPLRPRSAEDLASQKAPLPIPSLALPWGTRLWFDPYFDGLEGLLWLSEDGETVILRRATSIDRLRVGEAPEMLLALRASAREVWIDATVSDDGAVFAWRHDERVHWKRIDD